MRIVMVYLELSYINSDNLKKENLRKFNIIDNYLVHGVSPFINSVIAHQLFILCREKTPSRARKISPVRNFLLFFTTTGIKPLYLKEKNKHQARA